MSTPKNSIDDPKEAREVFLDVLKSLRTIRDDIRNKKIPLISANKRINEEADRILTIRKDLAIHDKKSLIESIYQSLNIITEKNYGGGGRKTGIKLEVDNAIAKIERWAQAEPPAQEQAVVQGHEGVPHAPPLLVMAPKARKHSRDYSSATMKLRDEGSHKHLPGRPKK